MEAGIYLNKKSQWMICPPCMLAECARKPGWCKTVH